MTVVTSIYRYKRPPRRKKAVALSVPAIVNIPKKRGREVAAPPQDATVTEPPLAKSAIVTTISRKRTKLLRQMKLCRPTGDEVGR